MIIKERDHSRYIGYCKRLDDLKLKYNPCGFNKGICNIGDNCCDDCYNLGESGCRIQSLYCKMWFCEQVGINEEIINTIKEIHKEIDKDGLEYFFVYRGSPW